LRLGVICGLGFAILILNEVDIANGLPSSLISRQYLALRIEGLGGIVTFKLK
jgi:hypothetical protein